MKPKEIRNRIFLFNLSFRNSWKAFGILAIGLLLTVVTVYYTRLYVYRAAIQDFQFTSNYLQTRMDSRLRAHSQLLRSGAALFAVSDTVTRENWRKYYDKKRINLFYPGIQGYGYTQIVKPENLNQHIQKIRGSGFPDYNIMPAGEREIYTSIVYLEPFTDRNLRAFGYDMFSEPVRRKAMETSRDANHSVLSGKVTLMQETESDVQTGSLMYFPVYREEMPLTTVEERRAAIKGWVYSPYRIYDLTRGILGNWEQPGRDRIRLQIYDSDNISDEALLYDSQLGDLIKTENPNLSVHLPVTLNNRAWTMVFTRNSDELTLFHGDLLIVLISGISISLFLFLLTLAYLNAMVNEREILLLNTRLEKLNKDKDRFISILGHDLKNPFNSMLGFLEILTKDMHILERDKIENYVNYVNNITKNTYQLLEDLLAWTSIQSGKIPFEPELYNLKKISLHVNKGVIPTAKVKSITINYLIDDESEVYADEEMLKTILRNLISKAIKFTGDNGIIRVKADEKPNETVISVIDNGVGMPPEELAKLFDISGNISTIGTANETGTGLGLILCMEFVEAHNGKIWAESHPGKGSRFMFSLPKQNSINADSDRMSY